MAEVDRAAHAGTLDPKVTGCLPVLLGDAARLARVFDDSVKEYVAVLELHGPAPADLAAVAAGFEGPIYQKPPRKSAVVRRLRVREIHDLDVLEVEQRRALLRVRCESGTYVRKLCHDLGLALGTGAHMGDLRRTATDPFDDTDLVTLHDLADALAWAEAGDEGPLREVVDPAERALVTLHDFADALAWAEEGDVEALRGVVDPAERVLAGMPGVTIAESAAREVAEGAPVYAPGVVDTPDVPQGTLVACFTPDGAAVCLGRLVGDPDAGSGVVVDLERVLVEGTK